jgi:hypothetical protein
VPEMRDDFVVQVQTKSESGLRHADRRDDGTRNASLFLSRSFIMCQTWPLCVSIELNSIATYACCNQVKDLQERLMIALTFDPSSLDLAEYLG